MRAGAVLAEHPQRLSLWPAMCRAIWSYARLRTRFGRKVADLQPQGGNRATTRHKSRAGAKARILRRHRPNPIPGHSRRFARGPCGGRPQPLAYGRLRGLPVKVNSSAVPRPFALIRKSLLSPIPHVRITGYAFRRRQTVPISLFAAHGAYQRDTVLRACRVDVARPRLAAATRCALQKGGVYGNQTVLPLFHRPLAPGGLWLLGERGHPVLRVSTQCVSDSEIREFQRLFPESTLWLRRMNRDGQWTSLPAKGCPRSSGENDQSATAPFAAERIGAPPGHWPPRPSRLKSK